MQQAVKMLRKPIWVYIVRLSTAVTEMIVLTPMLTEYSLCARDHT